MNQISSKHQILVDTQPSQTTESAPKQTMIAIACVSFFPLLYVVGSTIVHWLA